MLRLSYNVFCRTLIGFLLLSSIFFGGYGTAWAWVNGCFATGDLTGWTATLNSGAAEQTLPVATVVSPGAAPNTNGTLCPAPAICLNQVYSGCNYAAEIYSGNGDSNHGDWAQISQSDTVPAATPWISFWFAAVLEGAHYQQGDPYDSDAYVLVQVLQGATVIYTQRFSWYDNLALLVNDGSAAPNGPWMHLPWTQYYYDMTPYAGQVVTIQYTAYSCVQTAHYAYGFIDNAAWLSASQVPTMTPTATSTPTPVNTPTATISPTVSNTPTITNTPTVTASPTPTVTPTSTATYTPTCESHVLPNPYNSKYAVSGVLNISCIPAGAMVSLYTVSGERVFSLPGSSGIVQWNGRNQNGVPVSSGIYFYVIQQGTKVLGEGKVLIVGTN
jgi:hypothetical protein